MRIRIILIMMFSFLLIGSIGLGLVVGKENLAKKEEKISSKSSLKSVSQSVMKRSNFIIDSTTLIVGTITKLPVDHGEEPSFSSDGTQIVFVHLNVMENSRSEIWVVNTDGTNPHPIFQ